MFRVWIALDPGLPLAEVAQAARRAEALGGDCVTVADMAHDAFLAAGAAAQATERIEIVERLPRNASGKVKKFELRARLRQEAAR